MNDNELLQKILAELQGIKAEQQGMKEDLQGIKAEQQGMKEDLQGIKAEQQKMKEELRTFRAETREELSRINKMLNENFETTQVELVEAVKKEQKHSAEVDRKIANLEAVAAQNAYDVQLLKRRA